MEMAMLISQEQLIAYLETYFDVWKQERMKRGDTSDMELAWAKLMGCVDMVEALIDRKVDLSLEGIVHIREEAE